MWLAAPATITTTIKGSFAKIFCKSDLSLAFNRSEEMQLIQPQWRVRTRAGRRRRRR